MLPLNVNKTKKQKQTDSSGLMQEKSRTPFNGVLTKPYCSVWSFQNHITSSLSRECIYMHTLLWKVCSDRKRSFASFAQIRLWDFCSGQPPNEFRNHPYLFGYIPSFRSSLSSCLCALLRKFWKTPECWEMICLSWDFFNQCGCIYSTQGEFGCSLKLALHPV